MSTAANVERAGVVLRTLGHLADAAVEGTRLAPKNPIVPTATPASSASPGGVVAVILGLGLIIGVPLAVAWSRSRG